MSLVAESEYGQYDFATTASPQDWWRILRALGLSQTGAPFDEGVLQRAGYTIEVCVRFVDDGICHHAYQYGDCTICPSQPRPPVLGFTVREESRPVLCDGCVTFAAAPACRDCPPTKHEYTCRSCGSRRYIQRERVACAFCAHEKCVDAVQKILEPQELEEKERALLATLDATYHGRAGDLVALPRGYGRLKAGLKALGITIGEALGPDVGARIAKDGSDALKREAHQLALILPTAARAALRAPLGRLYCLSGHNACAACACTRGRVPVDRAIERLVRLGDAHITKLTATTAGPLG